MRRKILKTTSVTDEAQRRRDRRSTSNAKATRNDGDEQARRRNNEPTNGENVDGEADAKANTALGATTTK
jgi:hypothetical protein